VRIARNVNIPIVVLGRALSSLFMDIFQNLVGLLAGGESLALATIVSRSGSAPRAVGSRMAVRRDGSIIGTIGGGMLEARVQNLAKEVLSHGQAVLKKFVLTAHDASQMGMVCGGEVQTLVQFLDASRPDNLELYRDIVASLEARQRAWLITALPTGEDGPEAVAQSLIKGRGAIVGSLDHQAVSALASQAGASQPELLSNRGKPYLVEALCHAGTVYIFGAGHVSQQLAPLAALVGFYTMILDDRQDFANRKRFPNAHEVIVLDSFQRALEGLEINADSYLLSFPRLWYATCRRTATEACGTSWLVMTPRAWTWRSWMRLFFSTAILLMIISDCRPTCPKRTNRSQARLISLR
jgi:xanthine dehydrogenase accessory factor